MALSVAPAEDGESGLILSSILEWLAEVKQEPRLDWPNLLFPLLSCLLSQFHSEGKIQFQSHQEGKQPAAFRLNSWGGGGAVDIG